MLVWPRLQLTPYERRKADVYTEDGKIGVKRRIYRVTLTSQTQAAYNLPEVKTTETLQISRRARVFAILFSGNLDLWRLAVKNGNGTQYTNQTVRGHNDPIVSSLVAGSLLNGLCTGGIATPYKPGEAYNVSGAVGFDVGILPGVGSQSAPWLIEPNWVCQPNESLIFAGTPIEPVITDGVTSYTQAVLLNICVYVWEFPDLS